MRRFFQICVVAALIGSATASAGVVTTPERIVEIGQSAVPVSVGESAVPSLDVGAASTPGKYVALGDSYSSGDGNPPYSSAPCRRSDAAWPNTAVSPSVVLTKNLACSGARIEQLSSSWPEKGEEAQILAAAALQPDVVSLTIGGNDLGFSTVLADCFVSPGCDADGTLAEVRARLPRLGDQLADVYRTLKDETAAHVVVVGYPRIFPTTKPHNCAWLSERERKALNGVALQVDDTLRQAAAKAVVDYVSVLGVLAGHELCTADSWVYPIRIQCALPGRSNCGHPTRLGQRAIARLARPVISRR